MKINDPAVLAEVTKAFGRYETALVDNDVAALDGFFWQSEDAVRFGAGENLFGIAAIQAFRRARPAAGLARRLEATTIVTFGENFAVASTLFRRDAAPGKIGRQMQTWARLPQGWVIVAAQISVIDAPRSLASEAM